MITMISAMEAKQETKKYISDHCQEELNGIYKQIKEAIKDGKFAIHKDGDISNITENLLTELGYNVKKNFTNNEIHFFISWK